MGKLLTVGQIAQQIDSPAWRVRRVVDSLQRDGAEIHRAGLYRLVPENLLPEISKRSLALSNARTPGTGKHQ